MTVKLIKQMIDACRLGKRACDMMPPLPKDVLPSYIHVLDTVHTLEAADLLLTNVMPRPGVTRTVKEMEAKGYLTKSASPDDGRVTYITATEAGRQLWDKYDTQYFSELLPALQDIPEEDAACMIRTIETLYQVLSERRNNVGKQQIRFYPGEHPAQADPVHRKLAKQAQL